MEEEWRDINGYEGLYQVSNFGNVKSFPRNGTKGGNLKPALVGGYHQVKLYKDDKRFLVHRLVLQAFLPTEEKMEVDHINHDKTDNRLENLRWLTRSQNNRYQKKRDGKTSQYIGVSKINNKKPWRTHCKINGKVINIGHFATEEEAGRAYNNFIIKHNLQEFVMLNDI
jgi:hypothetical protein